MPNLIARWTRPASPTPLACFRIAVAAFFLVKLWLVRASVMELFGPAGFLPWSVTRQAHPGLPHLADLASLLARFGVRADETVLVVITVHVLALALLLVGVAARAAALVAFCTNLLLMHAGAASLYGMDYFAHIALTYCVIMPVGDALSLPVLRGARRGGPSVAAAVTRRMLQLQLCIVYTASGFSKARAPSWWNGEAVWRVLASPMWNQIDVSLLAEMPWLVSLAGWGVVLIESGYALGMGLRATRGVWLVLVFALHLGIGLFMGMWLFGIIMMILSAAAFGYEPAAALRARMRRTPRVVEG
jgi:hypothetical protein